MSKRKTIVIVLIVALLFVAVTISVFTGGGIVVSYRKWYGGQRDITLVDGLESDIWLEPRTTEFGIPFLLYYRGSDGPFGLRLQIWDESKQYVAIEIKEMILAYSDGESTRITNQWSRSLRPYTQVNSSSSGVISTEMFMLSDQIINLVRKHVDVTISITGNLKRSNGEHVDFSASAVFPARSDFDVSTLSEVMAGC